MTLTYCQHHSYLTTSGIWHSVIPNCRKLTYNGAISATRIKLTQVFIIIGNWFKCWNGVMNTHTQVPQLRHNLFLNHILLIKHSLTYMSSWVLVILFVTTAHANKSREHIVEIYSIIWTTNRFVFEASFVFQYIAGNQFWCKA
jgi:hypothetical protein